MPGIAIADQSMSASPSRSSSRGPSSTVTAPIAGSRSKARRVHSPTGSGSPSPAPLSRQLSARASVKGPRVGPRTSEQTNVKPPAPLEDTAQDVGLRVALKSQESELSELRGRLEELQTAESEHIRETQNLKEKLEDAISDNHRLEDELQLRLQDIAELRDRFRELQKSKDEYFQLAENEQQRFLEEKSSMIRSNSELSAQLKALRSSLQLERSRETSLSPEGNDSDVTLPSTSQDSFVREKERQIDTLRFELADIESRMAEQINTSQSRSKKLEDALLLAKTENRRLVDTVESYQILLQDRTLKGEYHLMSIESVREADDSSSSRATSPSFGEQVPNVVSLASELEEAEESDRTLQSEIRHLKDSNKAMSLYINDIIGRLLQTQGFEHVLEKDVNKSLPTPPPHGQLQSVKRTFNPRPTSDAPSRRSVVIDNPAHRRMLSETSSSTPPVNISGGLSRAFSFRKKEASSMSTNLRPLKLVEEQNPQQSMRIDGTTSHLRSRTHADDSELEWIENKAAKRASWVPGWFAKTGVGPGDEKPL